MGNTTSNSLDHRFKRLRLSQTEQMARISPSETSPKRKIATSTFKNYSENSVDADNNNDDRSPILSCVNVNSASLNASSTFETPKIFDENTLYYNPVYRIQSYKNFVTNNKGTNRENEELSDEKMIKFLRSTRFVSELSDSDIISCLTYEYLRKTDH